MMAKFIGKHTITMDDGGPYMTRYWIGRLRLHIFYRGDQDPDPHDHPWGFWTFPLVPYVEEVVDPRIAMALHGPHGELPQMVCEPSKAVRFLRVIPAFRLTFNRAEHAHRVIGRWNGFSTSPHGYEYPGEPMTKYHNPGVKSGKVVTIVWRQRISRNWGFIKNTGNKWCWSPWRKYIDGDKNAPCD